MLAQEGILTSKKRFVYAFDFFEAWRQWEIFLQHCLNVKDQILNNFFYKCLDIICDMLYRSLVEQAKEKYKMNYLSNERIMFRNFGLSGFLENVCFQQSHQPGETIQEARP